MPIGYHRATEVMPAQLAERAFSHLGSPCKVTFAPMNKRLNSSEKRLPKPLVFEIRAALEKSGLSRLRIIYFGPEMVSLRRANAKAASKFLVEEKLMPAQAVGSAVGVAGFTIRRWGIVTPFEMDEEGWPTGKRRKMWSADALSEEEHLRLHTLGYEHCRKMKDVDSRSEYGDFYATVGQCLEYLEEWQSKQPKPKDEDSFRGPQKPPKTPKAVTGNGRYF